MKLARVFMVAAMFFVLGGEVAFAAPGDVVLKRSGNAEKTYPPATFPHWAHSIRFRCYVCHPATFKMVKFKLQKGALKEDRQPLFSSATGLSPGKGDASGAEGVDEEIGKKEKPKKKAKASKKASKEASKESAVADDSTTRKNKMHGPTKCGRCHNGKVAFNVEFRACARCHVPKK